MQVNRDIVDTVVTQYMLALKKEKFLLASKYLCQLGNWGIRVVVKDIPKGIIHWYRKDESSSI